MNREEDSLHSLDWKALFACMMVGVAGVIVLSCLVYYLFILLLGGLMLPPE